MSPGDIFDFRVLLGVDRMTFRATLQRSIKTERQNARKVVLCNRAFKTGLFCSVLNNDEMTREV